MVETVGRREEVVVVVVIKSGEIETDVGQSRL